MDPNKHKCIFYLIVKEISFFFKNSFFNLSKMQFFHYNRLSTKLMILRRYFFELRIANRSIGVGSFIFVFDYLNLRKVMYVNTYLLRMYTYYT